ncbi:hypothetical protein NMG60_11026742, partial [Bertholletia excelsa]
MHRKQRLNSSELCKEFTTGNSYTCSSTQSSLYEQEDYQKSTFCLAGLMQLHGRSQNLGEFKTNSREEVHEDRSSVMTTLHFDSFLRIGTLGSEQNITELSTPTFPVNLQKVIEKGTEVKEYDLKLINDKLEKFLEAESKEMDDESSKRSSNVSVIPMHSKKFEGVNHEENGYVVCPLKEYLFGSSVKPPASSMSEKEKRTSQGKLFNKNSVACGQATKDCLEEEKHPKGTYNKHVIDKMLKKLCFSYRGPAASASGGASADPASTKRKLPKAIWKFHKKVHPEKSTEKEEFTEPCKFHIKEISPNYAFNKGGPAPGNKYKCRSPIKATLKKEIIDIKPTHKGLSSSGLTQKTEHWITTDANYLVLEL